MTPLVAINRNASFQVEDGKLVRLKRLNVLDPSHPTPIQMKNFGQGMAKDIRIIWHADEGKTAESNGLTSHMLGPDDEAFIDTFPFDATECLGRVELLYSDSSGTPHSTQQVYSGHDVEDRFTLVFQKEAFHDNRVSAGGYYYVCSLDDLKAQLRK